MQRFNPIESPGSSRVTRASDLTPEERDLLRDMAFKTFAREARPLLFFVQCKQCSRLYGVTFDPVPLRCTCGTCNGEIENIRMFTSLQHVSDWLGVP